MRGEGAVVVVGKSAELDLALSALEDLDLGIYVIPTVPEAERALLRTPAPRVPAVLVDLRPDAVGGLEFVQALRGHAGLGRVPVTVWAPATVGDRLTDAYRLGAVSGVLLDGTDEDAIRLARVIHYWAAANEPYPQQLRA